MKIDSEIEQLKKELEQKKKLKKQLQKAEREKDKLYRKMLSEIRKEGANLHNSGMNSLDKIQTIEAIVKKYLKKHDELDNITEKPKEEKTEKKVKGIGK